MPSTDLPSTDLPSPGPRFADPRLKDLDPTPDPLAPVLASARQVLERATTRFQSIADAALEGEWDWKGMGESDIRSGFYIAMQSLQRARGEVIRTSMEADVVASRTLGQISATTEARWELHGLLAPLDDDVLDADPGGGEWTVRGTLGHIVESQRAYAWFSAWWLARRDEIDFPPYVPDELIQELPSEDEQASGGLAAIRARLDGLVDLGSQLWQNAPEETLAVRARWSGMPVTLAFRVGRWAPHIEEHTVQVEKTLAMLGRTPSEVDRLTRLVYRAFGRLESAAWIMPTGALAGAPEAALGSAMDEVERIAAEVSRAARQ
ncbi:MAG: DinB family protein [Chloroflexi bacterium]|nr:DinB family protein [Chloroflexota bacterium]